MPSPLSRRDAVRAGGLGAVAIALSACGIRLESDAPRIPLVPTRTPRPGEAGLQALLDNGRAIRSACALWTGQGARTAATLAGLVERQDATLTELLGAAGAATATTSPATTATSSPATTSPTSTPTASGGSGAATGRVAAAATQALPELARIEADLVPTVVSIVASRAAWATTLGQPDPLAAAPTLTGPSSTPTPGAGLALGWLEATWAARYAFQVVTARSAGDQRRRGRRTLELLARTEAAQVAALGTTAPPEPVGYDLPFPVNDSAAVRRLAVHASEGLRTAYAAGLAGPLGPDPLLAPTRWLSLAERLVLDWGGTPEPFPGLRT